MKLPPEVDAAYGGAAMTPTTFVVQVQIRECPREERGWVKHTNTHKNVMISNKLGPFE